MRTDPHRHLQSHAATMRAKGLWKSDEEKATIRRSTLGVPRLCGDCRRGEHPHRSPLGCLEPFALAPYDFVCRCKKKAAA